VRFHFIETEKVSYPVRLLCRVLDVSAAGFYAWLGRPESERACENRKLVTEIRAIHSESGKRYGSPRVHAELKARGLDVGKNRVARLMNENGVEARPKRKFRRTTDSRHDHPLAENILARNFDTGAPNQVWVADITYIWTREGWLYLAAILDLFSRRVVGWATSASLHRDLALDALNAALKDRNIPSGLVHHSDRGCQYASDDYRKRLDANGIDCSMSRKGDCWDNAVAESFFATLKGELVEHEDFLTRDEADRALFEYMEVFYNRRRRHSSLGYTTPVKFELDFELAVRLAA
jgi:transposase InsO family protein